MITSIKIINSGKEELELVDNPQFDLLRIDGLTPPVATVDMVAKYSGIGSCVHNKSIPSRNIVISLNLKRPIEDNRCALYPFFTPHMTVDIEITRHTGQKLYTSGTVESFECDMFAPLQQPQISILCDVPYFITKTRGYESVTDEYTLEADADVAYRIPAVIEVQFTSTKAVNFFTISNATTKQSIMIDTSDYSTNINRITIDCESRTITLVRKNSSSKVDITEQIQNGTWIELENGINNIGMTVNGSRPTDIPFNLNVSYLTNYGGV